MTQKRNRRRGSRGFLAARRLSWHTFWARRAPWRVTLVKFLLLAALLIVAYLSIPGTAQNWVQQTLLAAVKVVASLTSVELLVGIAALLSLLSLAVIFVRPYRRATYLATTPSAIPLISVYVDAENQLHHAAAIPRFAQHVMEHLNGRRADLLFFMDASSQEHGAQTEQFKTLYRHGFRPVHVPHNPTGEAKKGVKEAVDKELAMHAHERALLGPPKQEFIIVTGDQDFVALVYRLAALGHHVQVWATPILPAYRALQTYLDIEAVDIARYVSEAESSSQEDSEDRREAEADWGGGVPASGRTLGTLGNGRPSYELAEPTLLSEAGEKQLYRAIMQTLGARDECEKRNTTQAQRLTTFRGKLSGELASRLASVGYRAASKVDYWLNHLSAAGVLKQEKKDRLPVVGSASPEIAAHALFIVAQLAADAAIAARQEQGGGDISMHDIANALLPQQARAQGTVQSLLDLIAVSNKKRSGHARYFIRCAQALGLVEFDNVPRSPDLIRAPRLVETSSGDVLNVTDEAAVANGTSAAASDAESDTAGARDGSSNEENAPASGSGGDVADVEEDAVAGEVLAPVIGLDLAE
jgi:NYN domain